MDELERGIEQGIGELFGGAVEGGQGMPGIGGIGEVPGQIAGGGGMLGDMLRGAENIAQSVAPFGGITDPFSGIADPFGGGSPFGGSDPFGGAGDSFGAGGPDAFGGGGFDPFSGGNSASSEAAAAGMTPDPWYTDPANPGAYYDTSSPQNWTPTDSSMGYEDTAGQDSGDGGASW